MRESTDETSGTLISHLSSAGVILSVKQDAGRECPQGTSSHLRKELCEYLAHSCHYSAISQFGSDTGP